VVSAIGMSIGAGFRAIGVITTGLILVVQYGLGLVERRVFGRCIYHDCQIAFDDDGVARAARLKRRCGPWGRSLKPSASGRRAITSF